MKKHLATYKLLALGFHFPDEKLLSALSDTVLFQKSLREVSLEKLQQEHTRIFSLSVSGGIPPYETEYGHRDIFQKTQKLADIAGFYKAFGMEVSSDAHERIDFIGAELELMYWLSLKEKLAEEKDQPEKAQICRDAAGKFMKDHLGRWALFFGEQIAKKTDLAFYRTLGQRLSEFTTEQCQRLEVNPEKVTSWDPAPPVDELSCDINELEPDQDHTGTCLPSYSKGSAPIE